MNTIHDRRFLGMLGCLGFLGFLGFMGSQNYQHLANLAWLASLAVRFKAGALVGHGSNHGVDDVQPHLPSIEERIAQM